MKRQDPEPSEEFLEKRKEILRRIRLLRLFAERSISSQTLGIYRSFFPGTGMDFSEIRGYYFGDDIRNISWPTTAKNRKLYVKSFKEDRSLNVVIAVDCSRSMGFWSKTRRQENMAYIAACLAFSALKVGDKAGLVLFSDRIVNYLPAKNAMRNGVVIIDAVLRANPSGIADFSVLHGFLLSILKEPSAIFLISDFFLSEPEIDDLVAKLRVLRVRHRVYPFSFWDQAEFVLPELGYARVRDMETQRTEWCKISEPLIEDYHRQMEKKRTYLRESFEKAGILYLPLLEGEDYGKRLFDFFKKKPPL